MKLNFGTIIFGIIMYNIFFGGGDDDSDVDIYTEDTDSSVFETVIDYKNDNPKIQGLIDSAKEVAEKAIEITGDVIAIEIEDDEITDETITELEGELAKLNKEIEEEDERVAKVEKKATVIKATDPNDIFATDPDRYGSSEDKW